jgi:hypothetical protein
MNNNLYNPNKYINHIENKLRLTPYFELDTDSIRNPKDKRVYYVGFEEEPQIKIQVTGPYLLNTPFEEVMATILKKLTQFVLKKRDRE